MQNTNNTLTFPLTAQIEGHTWIAIEPICQNLEQNFEAIVVEINDNPILQAVFTEQQFVDEQGTARAMLSLPETHIYGWLFSVRDYSPRLLAYRQECYRILSKRQIDPLETLLLQMKSQYERMIQESEEAIVDLKQELRDIDAKLEALTLGRSIGENLPSDN